MTPRFKKWLNSRGAKPADPELMQHLKKAMEKAQPEIEKEMRRSAIAAARVRREARPLFRVLFGLLAMGWIAGLMEKI